MKQSDKAKTTFRYYWRHAKAYPRALYGAMLTIPLTVLANAYLPSLIQADVLSKLSQHHFHGSDVWHNFGPELLAYAVLLLASVGLWRIVDHFVWRLEANTSKDIAEEVFANMLEKS